MSPRHSPSATRRFTVAALAVATIAAPSLTTAAWSAAAPIAATPTAAAPTLGISAANARDVGGYRTRSGATVRTGVAYRSNALTTLTDADKQTMVARRIGTVIDLRSPNEVAANPDNLPPVAYIRRPIWDSGADFYLTVNRIIAKGPAAQQAALGDGGAARLMRDYYRWMITSATSRSALAQTMRDIGASPTPVLFHCTSGKDRTGLLSAVMLTALGVDQQTVRRDYLASTTYLAAGNRAQMAYLVEKGLVADPALFAPILGVQRDFLDASFDQIRRSYGSFDRFLTAGLQLSDHDLRALRSRLIQRGPTMPFAGSVASGSAG
ncbi:tyrosine-protein phosphatase [Gordonia sp. OPL2]|uniref:tyrosine-protein phosphatase n=1 Tax=Gordonia sp. OPL2 TaxID=2486274 RepID=UPI0016556137|nr:tyrosine-protein phosphatase [Gordonia sp. OPL2]RPA02531.1 tyrosine-protein phosphatase [Gordonia sp. OPL2]